MQQAEGQVGQRLGQVSWLEGRAGVRRPCVGGRRALTEVHHERLHRHAVHQLDRHMRHGARIQISTYASPYKRWMGFYQAVGFGWSGGTDLLEPSAAGVCEHGPCHQGRDIGADGRRVQEGIELIGTHSHR